MLKLLLATLVFHLEPGSGLPHPSDFEQDYLTDSLPLPRLDAFSEEEYQILRKTDQQDFQLPQGWTFVSALDPSKLAGLSALLFNEDQDSTAFSQGDIVFIRKLKEDEYLAPSPLWRILRRPSTEDDFTIPAGWEAVEVTEANMMEYENQIGHLLISTILDDLRNNLVQFVRKMNSDPETPEVESQAEHGANAPEGDLVDDVSEDGSGLAQPHGASDGQHDSNDSNMAENEEKNQSNEGDSSQEQDQSSDSDQGVAEQELQPDSPRHGGGDDDAVAGDSRPDDVVDIAEDTSDLEGSKVEDQNLREGTQMPEDLTSLEDAGECAGSEFGCCEDKKHPAHGKNMLGCCSLSEHGCCPDSLSPASGPYFEGCDCKSTRYGCCPDHLTPASGAENEGCGCQYSEHGCCPDQLTKASGPDHEGCGCETFRHGCCPDGVTRAQGPNLEGCDVCGGYPHGCCPDGITPATGPQLEGCGCESSKYGCCLDSSYATGPNYLGCLTVPGENCHQPSELGSCTSYQEKWFYDMNYGGCNRFWYGGCEPGRNHYNSQEECTRECVSPRSSAVCFLKKVAGPCNGNYTEWYYDPGVRACRQFKYGGCLGNGNRFLTKDDCEKMCSPKPEVPVCEKPKAEGSCTGNFPRWFYSSASGECEQFSYSGCMGNNNRFMDRKSCEAVCRHAVLQRRSDKVCSELIEPGVCGPEQEQSPAMAVWGYSSLVRRCVPFYYHGCKGNQNRFGTLGECEAVCPTTFSPIITLLQGTEILLERGLPEALIPVTIKANPPADVVWRHNGVEISSYDTGYRLLQDFSLQINGVNDLSGGTYTVSANNGESSSLFPFFLQT